MGADSGGALGRGVWRGWLKMAAGVSLTPALVISPGTVLLAFP